MKNAIKPMTLAVIAAFLTACGGGGDSGGDAAPASNASPNATAASSKYVNGTTGSWTSNCIESPLYAAAAPTTPLRRIMRADVTRSGDNSVSFVLTNDIYPATGCTGAPLVSHRNGSSQNTITINSTSTAGAVTTDRVTFVLGNVGGISAGQTIILNGIVYPGDYFVFTENIQNIVVFEGATLKFGNSAPVDAQGYPTTVDNNIVFNRGW